MAGSIDTYEMLLPLFSTNLRAANPPALVRSCSLVCRPATSLALTLKLFTSTTRNFAISLTPLIFTRELTLRFLQIQINLSFSTTALTRHPKISHRRQSVAQGGKRYTPRTDKTFSGPFTQYDCTDGGVTSRIMEFLAERRRPLYNNDFNFYNCNVTIHNTINNGGNTLNFYECECYARNEALQQQEDCTEEGQGGLDGNFGNDAPASRPPVSEAIPRSPTEVRQINATHYSRVRNNNTSGDEREEFLSNYQPSTTLQKQGASLQADKQAMNSSDTKFTVDKCPGETIEIEKQLLQFIRDTASTMWNDTDLSDSQMQAIALKRCAEVSPTNLTKHTEGIRLWILEYIQQRIGKLLGCLESKFQDQDITRLTKGTNPTPRPKGKEDHPEVLVPSALVLSGHVHNLQQNHILVDEAHESQSHRHEDEKNHLDHPIPNDLIEATRDVQTHVSPCKRRCRRRLPRDRESPVSAKENSIDNSIDTSPSSQEDRADSPNAIPSQAVPANIPFHAKPPSHDFKEVCASEDEIGKQQSRGKAKAFTVASSTRDDAGLPNPNPSDDVFSQAKGSSDGFLESHISRNKSLESVVLPLERTVKSDSECNSRPTSPQKASSRANDPALSHRTQGSENTPFQHVISLESPLSSNNLLTRSTETDSGTYVHKTKRILTGNSF